MSDWLARTKAREELTCSCHPGYKGVTPKEGFVYRSRTNNVFLFWRSFFRDPKDLRGTVARVKATRIYPLGKKDSAKPMEFPNAAGVPANLLFPSEGEYFSMLADFIQAEVVDPADMDMRGMLHTIGIEKGKPFQPDAATKALLDQAARTAFKMSKMVFTEMLIEEPLSRFYPDRQWLNVFAGQNTEFQSSGSFHEPRTARCVLHVCVLREPGHGVGSRRQGGEVPGHRA